MILISHRGNINGPNPELENEPSYIIKALKKGYQCEIDIRYYKKDKMWWLGHDNSQYKTNEAFLFSTPNLILHCKNADALVELSIRKINGLTCPMFFWHEVDTYTLTSNYLHWTYIGKNLTELSICVLPEKGQYSNRELKSCLGICSDYIEKYKKI